MRGSPIRSTAFLISTLFLFSLAGCESGSDSSDNSSSSSASSSSTSTSSSSSGYALADVQVHFPPPESATTATTLTVRGSVQADAEVAAVFVDGNAVAIDAAGTWQYQAALASGANALSVTYETTDGDTVTAAELNVSREFNFVSPRQMALDGDGNRLLVLDGAQRAVLNVDATNGERTLLSPAAGETNLMTKPLGLALAPDSGQMLVNQHGEEPFILIGAADGTQAVAAEQPLAGVELIDTVAAMTYDGDGNYVIAGREKVVLDENGDRTDSEEDGVVLERTLLYHYNPVTGTKSVISQFDQPDTELPFAAVMDISTQAQSPYIYLIDYYITNIVTGARSPRVIRVTKSNGERALILPARDEDDDPVEDAYVLRAPTQIEPDPDGSSLWLLDNSELIRVDLETFEGVEVSGAEVPEDGAYNLLYTVDMALNANANWAYALSDGFNRIVRVETATGTRDVLSDNVADDQISFASPVGLSLNKTTDEIYVADRERRSVFDFDMSTGVKTTLLERVDEDDDGQSDNLLIYPLALASDQGQRVFVLDDLNETYRRGGARSNYPRLYAIDIESQTTTAIVGFNSTVIQLKDLSYDPANNHIYVLASFPGQSRSLEVVYRVDLNESPTQISVLSSSGVPDTRYQFNSTNAVAWDAAGNRVLVLDAGNNALMAVDAATGARTILSGIGIPAASEFDFELPITLAVDQPGNRAWVIDTAKQALITVDLATGARTVAFENEFFAQARDIQVHAELGYALVSSVLSNRVDAFDLETGESVTISY